MSTSIPRRPSQQQLDDAELEGADLSGRVLKGLRLTGRNLRGARLVGAVLTQVELRGADLSGADLSDAELSGADLSEARLVEARLLRVRGEDVALSGADLSGASLVGAVLLRPRLERAALAGADLEQVRLEGLSAPAADFSDARLVDADLAEGAVPGARFERADLSGAHMEAIQAAGASFAGAALRGARLDGADLSGAVLEGADLCKAVISGASLEGVETPERLRADGLVARRIHGASEALTALLEAEGARLGPGLLGALVQRARKLRADRNLSHIDAEEDPAAAGLGADSAETPEGAGPREIEAAGAAGGAEAAGAAGSAETAVGAAGSAEAAGAAGGAEAAGGAGAAAGGGAEQGGDSRAPGVLRRALRAFARGQRPAERELVPGADLSGRDLRRLRLPGVDLSGADLRECRLDGADLSGADLSGARLDGARLDGARLSDARLVGASAERTRFDDAVLRRADLRELSAPSASFIGARFDGARFDGASLVGADLSAAGLADVDLADADLSGTLLEQADLAGATLDRVAVEGAEVDGALGLSAETLEQLEARGAKVSRFSLARLLAGVGPARALKFVAAVGCLSLGGYLIWQFELSENAETEALVEGAGEAAEAGEIERALEGYRELVELAELPAERVGWRLEMVALYTEAERYGEALEQLEQAIREAGDEPELQVEVRLRYARLLATSGETERAVAAYRELVDEDLEPAPLAQAIVGLSDLYTSMDRADEALALQQEILDRYPNNQSLVVTLSISIAELYSAAGQDRAALEVLERIWGYPLDDEQRASLMLAKARVYEALGDPDRALETYSELLRIYPTYDRVSGDVLLSMATLFYRQGEVAEARGLLEQLQDRGGAPQVLARGQLLAASIEEQLGELDAARERYQRVIADFPDDRDALETARVGLARILVAQNPDAALDEGLIEGDDPEVVAQILLGQAQRREDVGDVEAAAALYQRVIDEYPSATGAVDTARFRKAGLLASAESYAEAINAYRELLSEATDPDSKMVIEAAIAETYLLAGQVGNAEAAYTSLLTGAAPDSEAAGLGHLGLGAVAEARGNIETARRHYQRVIDEVSDPTLVGAALESLARSYLESGRDEEAMQIYRRFLASLPEGHIAAFSARRAMAGILERRGEHAEALALYAELIAAAPDSERRTEVELARAELLETSGDPTAARRAYQELLDGRALRPADREDAAVGLARSTLQLGDAAAALQVTERFEALIQTRPTLARLLQVRAQALRALGRSAEADALAERILALAGDDGDAALRARMEQANGRMNEGEYDEAITLYRALIEEVEDRPTVAALKNAVAQALLASGDMEAAWDAYQTVIEEYPDLAEAVFSAGMGLADVERRRGEPEAAVARYRALEAPDAGSEVWRLGQLAAALSDSGDEAGAEAIYKSLINDYAGDARAQAAGRMGWAGLLHARDEFQAARALYLQVAEQSPDPVEREWARLRAANTLADEGEDEQALEALSALIEAAQDPEVSLQARLASAAILLERGEAEEGLALLDGLDVAPLGPAWVAALVQQRVACLTVLGEYERARGEWLEVLERWGELDDAASQARLGLGDLAVEQGETEAALERYGEVLETSADRHYQARAILGRAGAYRAAGRLSEARGEYERLVEQYPEQSELVATAERELEKLSN